MISLQRLKEVVEYNPETGVFTWRVQLAPRGKAGTKAGCNDPSSGYVLLRIDGKLYRAHVLAWFYSHGTWPVSLIDHKNCKRDDNRLSNLRPASHSQNFQNGRRRRDNTSGMKGVSWDRSRNLWKAQICVYGKRICLGRFPKKEQAGAAYLAAADRFFGEFARAA